MDRANESFNPLTDTEDFPYIDGQEGPVNGTDTSMNAVKEAPRIQPSGGMLQLCGRYSFPWLLTLSVVQLGIFLNKLYHDCSAVSTYFEDNNFSFCIISAACLLVPAFVYIIYIVSLYIKEQDSPETKEVGTKVVHGLLLVPWQIRGRVEVLQFSAQRVCQTRKPTSKELEEKSLLDRQAAVLEFFPAFYAGLTQLLLQLYIIIVALDQKQPYQACVFVENNGQENQSISTQLSFFKGMHVLTSLSIPYFSSVFLVSVTGQIIASALTLTSMMAAVRRRDDGILTGALSITGWTSIMVSRAVAISLAATILNWWIVLICVIHALVISLWVTFIAVKTYPESSLNKRRKTALFFLIFSVFGLPSLTYWPIMFELKKNRRPIIYLMLLLLENVCLIVLWAVLREDKSWYKHDVVLVTVTTTCFVMGTLFIMFYTCCKPKYTDYVVYHDMKASNADSFGMYFEFCDAAFKLKRKEEVETHLKEIREQRT